jgi:C4-type Zn-finger protein
MIESIKLICDNCKKTNIVSIEELSGKFRIPTFESVVRFTWRCGHCYSDSEEELQGKISLK